MAATRPRWSTRRKLALQLALLPLLLVATEGLFRVYLAVGGMPYDAEGTRAEVQELAARLGEPLGAHTGEVVPMADTDEDRGRIPHPYLGWDMDFAQEPLTRVAGTFEGARAEQRFDVLVVGGSVAGGFIRHGTELLKEQLEADPRLAGRRVQVLGHARGGYKQPQQLNLVGYLLAIGWRPDAVVNIDGFNELALARFNSTHDAHPLHPSAPHWASLAATTRADRATVDLMLAVRREQLRGTALADRVERWGLHRSAILGRLARTDMIEARAAHAAAQERYAAVVLDDARRAAELGPPFEAELEEVLELALDAWVECSVSLGGLSEAHGIRYLHVLQPTLHDRGSKPLTKKEVASGHAVDEWIEAVEAGYPRMRERADELRARGVAFADASLLFAEVEEPLYYDACHFRDTGHRRLARFVARELLATLD